MQETGRPGFGEIVDLREYDISCRLLMIKKSLQNSIIMIDGFLRITEE